MKNSGEPAARRMLRVLLLLLVAMPLSVACSPSTGSLEGVVDDAPGVTRVAVEESDGDNDIPFATIPKHVTVRMEADATNEEVLGVFDSYDDHIEEGDVIFVEVALEGSKQVSLSSGEGIHVTPAMVEDLVTAQHDESVLAYRRQAYPVLPSVELELAPTTFGEVVKAAERYRDADDVEHVTVLSGDFLLIRDEVNENPMITSAREEVVHRVGAQFQLRGASVSGRGPLELFVARRDEEAVRRFVVRHPVEGPVGHIIVETHRRHAH